MGFYMGFRFFFRGSRGPVRGFLRVPLRALLGICRGSIKVWGVG